MPTVRPFTRAALVTAVLAAGPSIVIADDEPPPAAPSTADTPPAQAADAEAAKDSLASPPAVALFRGGTLGIPSPVGNRSIQASSTLKFDKPTDGTSVDLDFMTKVGGVNLYDKVMVDIVGERYQQALPVITLGGPTALPIMTPTSVKSAGMRIVLRGASRDFDIYRSQTVEALDGKARTGLLEARRVFAGTSGDWYSLGLRALHPDLPGADEGGLNGFATELMWQRVTDYEPTDDCKKDLEQAVKRAQDAEAKVVARKVEIDAQLASVAVLLSEVKSRPDAGSMEAVERLEQLSKLQLGLGRAQTALKAEISTVAKTRESVDEASKKPKTVCGPARRRTYFLSLSATYLNSQRLTPEGKPAITMPAVFEGRLAAGAEMQSGTNLGKYLLPRLGAYGSVSAARWDNDFAVDGAAETVNQWQAEFALYTSGHFSGGFSGQFSIGVLVPYGHDSEPQAFINITPTVGSTLGGS